MFIYSWVFDNGARSWRIGSNYNSSFAFMTLPDTGTDCPYETDGSRFVKDFLLKILTNSKENLNLKHFESFI